MAFPSTLIFVEGEGEVKGHERGDGWGIGRVTKGLALQKKKKSKLMGKVQSFRT